MRFQTVCGSSIAGSRLRIGALSYSLTVHIVGGFVYRFKRCFVFKGTIGQLPNAQLEPQLAFLTRRRKIPHLGCRQFHGGGTARTSNVQHRLARSQE